MALEFAGVLYNPKRIIVASVSGAGVFGTPVDVDYFQKASFDVESDTDEIKSGGLIVEKLSVATKVVGTLSSGSLNFLARAIMEGDTPTSVYGVSPNQYQYLDMTVGGAGNPYFAMIIDYAASYGGNVLIGFPKVMLTKKLGNDVDQNKFRVAESAFEAVAPNPLIRRACRTLKYETAASIQLTSVYVTGFFNGMM